MTVVLGREFTFSDRHFKTLKEFIRLHTGIVLTEAKKDMVYGRLSKRVRVHFDGSFDAFCKTIENGDGTEQEYLINAITTNLTGFFRENHHFEYLQKQVLPELIQQKQRHRRLRIWSAGCSTGEEAYSIAMACHEAIPDIQNWDIKILATDLDANAVIHGREGIYSLERISGLDVKRQKRWFQPGKNRHAGLVRIRPQVRDLVTFKRLNLLHDWPMSGPFDVIFCRNVVIYFDKPTQTAMFERYADIMVPGGYLFIGHSESLYKVSRRFASLGHTIYRQLPE